MSENQEDGDEMNNGVSGESENGNSGGKGSNAKGSGYAPAQFQNLQDDSASKGQKAVTNKLDMILDISVTLAVEIGRSKINIKDLLKLNQGSVIELERLAGEPMDVFVNGTLIAHGEVVVVNEKFGVRLTDVVSHEERVRPLG